VELAQSANTTNDVMKTLNGFAGIFLPITFVTSLFGMNIAFPGMVGCEFDVYFNLGSLLGFHYKCLDKRTTVSFSFC